MRLLCVLPRSVWCVFPGRIWPWRCFFPRQDRLETGIIYLASILATVAVYAALSVAYYQYGNRRFHTERWDFGYPAKDSVSRKTMAAVLSIVVCVGLFYIYDLVRNGSELSEELLIETEITAHRGSSRDCAGKHDPGH